MNNFFFYEEQAYTDTGGIYFKIIHRVIRHYKTLLNKAL